MINGVASYESGNRFLDASEEKHDRIVKIKNIVAGIDGGNLHYRVRFGENENLIQHESYVLPMQESDIETGHKNLFKLLSASNDSQWVGKSWLLGANAISADSINGMRVLDSEEGKAELSLPLLIGSLWEYIPRSGGEIRVCISCHNTVVLADKIKTALNGAYTAAKDGEHKQFTIEVLEVYAEGVGVIRNEKPTSKAVFMLDFGSDTLIASSFNGFVPQCNPMALSAFGVRSLVGQIMRCDEMSKSLGRMATFNEVLNALENPVEHAGKGKKASSVQYRINDVNVTNAIVCEVDSWLDRGLKEIARSTKDMKALAVAHYVTGGGCKIPQVAAKLQDLGYTVVSDPILANVNGLYLIAQMKAAKQVR